MGGNLPKDLQTIRICNKNAVQIDCGDGNFGNIPKTEGKHARWGGFRTLSLVLTIDKKKFLKIRPIFHT